MVELSRSNGLSSLAMVTADTNDAEISDTPAVCSVGHITDASRLKQFMMPCAISNGHHRLLMSSLLFLAAEERLSCDMKSED
jgi:hypothetical protein